MKKHLLTAAALTLLTATAHANGLVCDPPVVLLGDTAVDTDPVVSVDVDYDHAARSWQIFHHHRSGLVASRAQQYAIEDYSDAAKTRWAGSLNRNRKLYMVGEAAVNYRSGEGYYEEWLYDRSHGNRLDMHMRAACQLADAPPPVAITAPLVRPVPLPVPVPVAPAPVQPSGPVQQNGPIVVAPSAPPIIINNYLDRVIPGTTYTPEPK